RGAGHKSVMQRLLPGRFEVCAHPVLPIITHDLVSRPPWLSGASGKEFASCPSTVQRIDQRLKNGDRTVRRARIAPGFQVMSRRNVPVTQPRCFVFEEPEMNSKANLFENLMKSKINGSIENRIAAENCEHAD